MDAEVQAPDGRRWVVRRRWLPRWAGEGVWSRFRRRTKGLGRRAGDGLDGADAAGCALEGFEALVVVVFVVVGLLLLAFVVVPLLLAVLELLALVLLVLLGAGFRVLFRRPWRVEARSSDGRVLEWRIVGWRASGRARHQAEQQLQAGVVPEALGDATPGSPGAAGA